MISIVRQDFAAASRFLEAAYAESPQHRGVIKSLAYCYLWLGDIEKAETFLSMIPEAREELDAYVSWWGTQGRDDLSEKAAAALNDLKSTTNQP
jgi:thioredoxin-like negative regulator of GroEL